MEPLPILCVLLGVFIIVVRGPMIFAPRATLRFFDMLISTDTGIRGIGLFAASVAWALLVFATGESAEARILHGLGWIYAAATVWLLVAPGSYRHLVRGILGFLEHSADMAVVRLMGLFAVVIGIGVIYVGLYVV